MKPTNPEFLSDLHLEPASSVDRTLLPPQIRKVEKPMGYVALQSLVDSQAQGIIDSSEGYQPFGPILGYERDFGSEYLDVNLDRTKGFIKERFAPVDNENMDVIVGFSGSNELLERICMSFEDDTEIWGLGPHFTGFAQSVKVVGRSRYVPIAPPLDMPLETALNIMMEKTPDHFPDALFISNPDSRGNVASKDTLAKFIDYFTSKGVMIIMDEVNGDFLDDEESVADLTNDNSYLVVVRSYSKALDFPEKGMSMIIAHRTYANEFTNQMRDHHYRTDAKAEVEYISDPESLRPKLAAIRRDTGIYKNMLLDKFIKYEIPYLPSSGETPIVFIDGGEEEFYDELINYVKCTPGIGYSETYNDLGNEDVQKISDVFFGEFDKTPLSNRYVRVGLPKIEYSSLTFEEIEEIYDTLAKDIRRVMAVVQNYRSQWTTSSI